MPNKYYFRFIETVSNLELHSEFYRNVDTLYVHVCVGVYVSVYVTTCISNASSFANFTIQRCRILSHMHSLNMTPQIHSSFSISQQPWDILQTSCRRYKLRLAKSSLILLTVVPTNLGACSGVHSTIVIEAIFPQKLNRYH